MVFVVITHPVEDFAKWKKAFDDFAGVRKEGGELTFNVLTDAENDNLVTVINKFESIETARSFFKNPKLAETMKKVGVIGQPDIKFLISQDRSYH